MKEQFEKNIEEQAALFAALSDATRLRLIKLLSSQRSPDALCVNALASILGISQSAVSQHLRILRSAGLVKGKRRGYRIHYSMNPEIFSLYRHLIAAVLSIDESENKVEQK